MGSSDTRPIKEPRTRAAEEGAAANVLDLSHAKVYSRVFPRHLIMISLGLHVEIHEECVLARPAMVLACCAAFAGGDATGSARPRSWGPLVTCTVAPLTSAAQRRLPAEGPWGPRARSARSFRQTRPFGVGSQRAAADCNCC